MNCKTIRPHIIAYIDNELSPSIKKQVSEHLSTCNDCQLYKQELESLVIQPLQTSQSIPVPEGLWDSIKNQLPQKQINMQKPPSFLEIVYKWIQALTPPRPVLATMSIVLLIALTTTAVTLQKLQIKKQAQVYIAENIDYLFSLDNGTFDFLLDETTDDSSEMSFYL